MVSDIGLNATEVIGTSLKEGIKDFFNSLPIGISGNLAFLINLSKAIGIAVLVYIIFLIIRSIVGIKSSLRMKSIANNVQEINDKMDILLGRKSRNNKNKK